MFHLCECQVLFIYSSRATRSVHHNVVILSDNNKAERRAQKLF